MDMFWWYPCLLSKNGKENLGHSQVKYYDVFPLHSEIRNDQDKNFILLAICSIRPILFQNKKEVELTFLLIYTDAFYHQTTILWYMLKRHVWDLLTAVTAGLNLASITRVTPFPSDGSGGWCLSSWHLSFSCLFAVFGRLDSRRKENLLWEHFWRQAIFYLFISNS